MGATGGYLGSPAALAAGASDAAAASSGCWHEYLEQVLGSSEDTAHEDESSPHHGRWALSPGISSEARAEASVQRCIKSGNLISSADSPPTTDSSDDETTRRGTRTSLPRARFRREIVQVSLLEFTFVFEETGRPWLLGATDVLRSTGTARAKEHATRRDFEAHVSRMSIQGTA